MTKIWCDRSRKRKECSTRIESCKAYSLTRNCTTFNRHYSCTQSANDSRNIIVINQPTAQPSVFHRTKFGVFSHFMHCLLTLASNKSGIGTLCTRGNQILNIFLSTPVWHSLALIIPKMSRIMIYRRIIKQPTSHVYDLSFHKFLKIFVM